MSETIQCPGHKTINGNKEKCVKLILVDDLENVESYICPECETELQIDEDEEGEDLKNEDGPNGKNQNEDNLDENKKGENINDIEKEEIEISNEKMKKKPKKSKIQNRSKNPNEIKKYYDFIIKQKNGVRAEMISEEFGVGQKFSRLMIRASLKMANEKGYSTEKKIGEKGKKTYFIKKEK